MTAIQYPNNVLQTISILVLFSSTALLFFGNFSHGVIHNRFDLQRCKYFWWHWFLFETDSLIFCYRSCWMLVESGFGRILNQKICSFRLLLPRMCRNQDHFHWRLGFVDIGDTKLFFFFSYTTIIDNWSCFVLWMNTLRFSSKNIRKTFLQ